ncbi:gluconokinase [Microbacterium invictum]|nr:MULTISPECIES: gluconokinase [Microbacterium]
MVAPEPVPPLIVVMGVSASGKSTLAAALADQLGIGWIDADDLHPAENRAKMASGIPLDDSDRWPWLDSVGDALTRAAEEGGVVVACSALRRIYRDRLRAVAGERLVFVHLDGSREMLEARAIARQNHFMPPALLSSQFATLEPLQVDEEGVTMDVARPVTDLVAAFVTEAGRPPLEPRSL